MSSLRKTISAEVVVPVNPPEVYATDINYVGTTGGPGGNGFFLRIFGRNFGLNADRGTAAGSRVFIGTSEVATYYSIAAAPFESGAIMPELANMQVITVQVGALGGQAGALAVKVTTNGVDSNTDITVTPMTGQMKEATTATWTTVIAGKANGDQIYFRAGTYTGSYRQDGWVEAMMQFSSGGADAQPIHLTAYPGEDVFLQHTVGANGTRSIFYLRGATGRAHNMAFSMFRIEGRYDIMFCGADTTSNANPESGARNTRFYGNNCRITDTVANTQSGYIAGTGDGIRIGCSYFTGPTNRAIYNNNHILYLQNAADDQRAHHNFIKYPRCGHVIQVHQDGLYEVYENIRVDHNEILGNVNTDCRGVLAGGSINRASTIFVHDNYFRNLGQNFSAVAVYSGTVKIYDNYFDAINSPIIILNGQIISSGGVQANIGRNVEVYGNRMNHVSGQSSLAIYSSDTGANAGELNMHDNYYCGVTAPVNDTNPLACND